MPNLSLFKLIRELWDCAKCASTSTKSVKRNYETQIMKLMNSLNKITEVVNTVQQGPHHHSQELTKQPFSLISPIKEGCVVNLVCY